MTKTFPSADEMLDKLDVSGDVLRRAFKISVYSGRRAVVENHRGVLDFTPDRIEIAAERSKVYVMGTGLLIKAINKSDMLIIGKIQSVEWE